MGNQRNSVWQAWHEETKGIEIYGPDLPACEAHETNTERLLAREVNKHHQSTLLKEVSDQCRIASKLVHSSAAILHRSKLLGRSTRKDMKHIDTLFDLLQVRVITPGLSTLLEKEQKLEKERAREKQEEREAEKKE